MKKLYKTAITKPPIKPSINAQIPPITPPQKEEEWPTYIPPIVFTKGIPQPNIENQPATRAKPPHTIPMAKARLI